MEGPRPERDHRSAVPGDGNDEPVPEPVRERPPVPGDGQPAAHEEIVRVAPFAQVRGQAVAGRRGEPQPQPLRGLRGDAAGREVVPGRLAPRLGQARREELRRGLVDADEGLALGLRRGVAVGGGLGDPDADALGEVAHRVLEPQPLLELDELEDVAAHAAPEAVEEALVRMHVERGRLFGVERAEAHVAGALPAGGGTVGLHHLHDVRLRLQVVDERLGEQAHVSGSFLQLGDRHGAAAVLGGRRRHAADAGVRVEKPLESSARNCPVPCP